MGGVKGEDRGEDYKKGTGGARNENHRHFLSMVLGELEVGGVERGRGKKRHSRQTLAPCV